MSQKLALLSFNRGLISKLGMARADVKRLAMSAEVFTNWMVRVLGSMMLRPGLGHIGTTAADAAARFLPFVFSASDKAKLEFTNLLMRVWINDALVMRVAVTTAIANGTWPIDLTSWTDNDEGGAVSTWAAGGYMQLLGTGTAAAIRDQTVATAAANLNKVHALRVVVQRGPVTIRVGSSAVGSDEYITETELGAGTHSLAFTPTASPIYVRLMSRLDRIVLVDECTIEAAGVLTLPTPWATANLGKMRYDQSGDIVYIAASGKQQYKIERRAATSWSVVKYQPKDGPFQVENTTTMTMTPSVLTGNGTLTASSAFFRSTHVGALFAVTSTGQAVAKSMTVLNDATDSIEVTGITTDRAFTIVLSGLTATGNTVVLQRSFDDAVWVDVATKSWTADATESYTDGLDNQIVYYRLLCSVYAAGATAASLDIATGSVRGVGRVTAYTSATVVSIEVLKAFGKTTASDAWEEGTWSDKRGWPSAVRLYEGRLYWVGKDKINGSVSDGYESFDKEVEGDSGPINRSIGSGPVDSINFALGLQRLILGGQGAEHSCRSTAFDEPLTPTNFNVKRASGQGSSSEVDAVEIDKRGIYVQRGGVRVFQLSFDTEAYDYASEQLSQLIPTIGKPGIVRIAVQRQPDTRVHFIRSDGTAAVLVFDKIEQVIAWLNVKTPAASGAIEDVVVLPCDEGEEEDHVYYVVRRTINGATKRFIERWATEEQGRGGTLCMLADSYVSYTGAATTTISAPHLALQNVAVWADGEDIGTVDAEDGSITYTYTLDAAGNATIPTAVTNYVVGLPYVGQWGSAKLVQIQSQLGQQGVSLTSHKNIDELGIIAADLHPKGIRFGPDFDHMDSLPSIEGGTAVDQDAVHEDYHEDPIHFPGTWTIDARLCLEARSPRPATVLALVCAVKSND